MARKSQADALALAHDEWRERMRVLTEQMRESRERQEAVWGVATGAFRNGQFVGGPSR